MDSRTLPTAAAVLAFGLAIVCALYVVGGPPTRAAQPGASQPSSASAAVSASSANEGTDPSLMRLRPVMPAMVDGDVRITDRPRSPEATEEEDQAQVATILLRLERALDQESLDDAWAPQHERAIQRSVVERYPDRSSRLVAVRCRATLCRLELTHRGPDDEEAFLRDFGRLEGFGNTQAFYAVADGAADRRTVIFVSRAGGHLPGLD